MSKHDQNRAEKRDRLIAAGLDAFTETGYDNATVSDIVRRAGMTPSTFYNYFRDKEALRDEWLEQIAADLRAGVDRVCEQSETVDAFVGAIFRSLFSAVVSDQHLTALLRRNLAHLRSVLDHPVLDPVFDALKTGIVYVASANGATSMNPDYAAALFGGAAVEVGVSMLGHTPPDVDGAVEFVTTILAGGIANFARLKA